MPNLLLKPVKRKAQSGNLDTLAQLPTKAKLERESRGRGVQGAPPLQGCDTIPFDNLKKRARSKWYGNKVIAPLLYIDSPLHKQYQRAYYCNQTLLQAGNKITAKYCNSRVCHICNRIRTAKFLNGYGDPLQKLGELQFVTLTVPNCKADKLKATITGMCRNITNTMRVLREKKKLKVSGVRKIEVTYNEKDDTYHPHFHITVDKGVGGLIVDSWLQRYPEASAKAQDVRKADRDSFNELFKYSTKIVSKVGSGMSIYVCALDVIMCALDKRRTFQTFGKIKKVSEDIEELQAVEIEGLDTGYCTEWIWNDENNDWYDLKTGAALTDYKPPDIVFTVYM